MEAGTANGQKRPVALFRKRTLNARVQARRRVSADVAWNP